MSQKSIPLAQKVEVVFNQVNSAANDVEQIMSGLEEVKDSGNLDDLQDALATALSDLDTLYCELKGDETDEELSEAFHRAHLR